MKKMDKKDLKKEIPKRTLGYILAAFGFVAALAWNDAIKSVIDRFFPLPESGIKAKLIYAIAITLIVVIATIYYHSLFDEDEDKNNKGGK